MAVCLDKNSIDDFWFDAKNFYITNNTYVKYTILHLNIRSMNQNFRSFEISFLNQVSKVDILIFSEVNIKEHEVNKFKINGFKIFSKTREDERGGGIVIYVKSSFVSQEIISDFNFAESLALKINNEITVLAVYRRPSFSKVNFLDELDNFLSSNKDNNLVFCGDININLLLNEDSVVTRYEDVMAEHGLLKLIDLPTREEVVVDRTTNIAKITRSLIDHMYVRVRDLNHIAAVLKIKISDHYPIAAMFYVQTRDKKVLTYDSVDFNSVNNDLSSYNWSRLKDLNSPCKTLENCASYIQSVKDVHTHTKTIYTKKRVNKAWITPQLEALAAERCRLFRRSKSNPTNKQYREEYKMFRNYVNVKFKNAERSFNLKCFKSCEGNVKKTWSRLNDILGRSVNSIDDTIMRYMTRNAELPDILSGFGEYFAEAPALCSHTCHIVTLRQPAPLALPLQSMHLAPPTQTQISAVVGS
jgi:hypothetical protein